MNEITFREFDKCERDYEIALAIHNAFYHDSPNTMQSFKHNDNVRNPKHYFHRIMMQRGDDVIGYGGIMERFWDKVENTYVWFFYCKPEEAYTPLVSQFYEMALTRIERECGQIDIIYHDSREDRVEQVAFLEGQGYVLDNRYPRSELDLTAFDFAPYAGLGARMDSLGLTIKSGAELTISDPDYQRKLYDLDWILEQDEPSEGEWIQQPFDEYVKSTFGHPEYNPESWFIAVDPEGNYAGISMLFADQFFPEKMHTGWTGVDRPYRRKGVATAMKIKAFEYARAHGIKRIQTDNHETNHMYQINLQFGFSPLPAYLDYKKVIKGA
jgi:GNAT superfamily N-acetyltransferase